MKHSLLASVGMLLLSACARAGPAVASSAAPTVAPAATASLTQTPEPAPSAAATPTPMPATLLPPAGVNPRFACELNWQHPVNGTKLEPRSDFTVRWNVTNTGDAAWQADEVTLEFAGGTAMHFSPVLTISETVAPGQSITLSVDMKALRNTSSYVTTWALHQGEAHFCTLSLMIYVQWENDRERNW